MNTEKLKELMSDKGFVEELFTKKTAEEAQAFFAEKGVDLSLDDVKSMGSTLEKVVKGEITQEQVEAAANGELSEDALEEVAGGYVPGIVTAALIIGGSAVVTGGTAAGITAVVKNFEEITDWFRSW